MCIANQPGKQVSKPNRKVADGSVRPIRATDVPIGDGLAGSATNSVLKRRERIRQAVEDAGG